MEQLGSVYRVAASLASLSLHVALGGHLVAHHLNTPAAILGYFTKGLVPRDFVSF